MRARIRARIRTRNSTSVCTQIRTRNSSPIRTRTFTSPSGNSSPIRTRTLTSPSVLTRTRNSSVLTRTRNSSSVCVTPQLPIRARWSSTSQSQKRSARLPKNMVLIRSAPLPIISTTQSFPPSQPPIPPPHTHKLTARYVRTDALAPISTILTKMRKALKRYWVCIRVRV